jgi:hypothetical protein
MKNKILLFGFSASGKTQFNRLIDGHSKISVIERHDKLLNPLIKIYNDYENFGKNIFKNLSNTEAGLKLDKSVNERVKLKYTSKNINFNLNIYLVRLLLQETGYYTTEYWSFYKKAEEAAASKNLNDNFQYDFDFNLFEELWKKKLFENSKALSVEEFNDIFLESYLHAKGVEINDNLLFQSPNTLEAIDFVLNENFNIKIICLRRSYEGTIKSKALRAMYLDKYYSKKIDEITSKDFLIEYYIMQVLNSSYLERLKVAYEKIEDYMNSDKKKFFIVSSESLISDPKNTIKKVINWLGLPEEEILYESTFKGKKVENSGFGKIFDDDLILEISTQNFLKFRVENNNFLILLNCKEKIKTFYKIIKYYYYKYLSFKI